MPSRVTFVFGTWMLYKGFLNYYLCKCVGGAWERSLLASGSFGGVAICGIGWRSLSGLGRDSVSCFVL